MFGSFVLESAFALALLVVAGALGGYLYRASRRARPPYILRNDALSQAVTILELGLVVFGAAYLVDAMVQITNS